MLPFIVLSRIFKLFCLKLFCLKLFFLLEELFFFFFLLARDYHLNLVQYFAVDVVGGLPAETEATEFLLTEHLLQEIYKNARGKSETLQFNRADILIILQNQWKLGQALESVLQTPQKDLAVQELLRQTLTLFCIKS